LKEEQYICLNEAICEFKENVQVTEGREKREEKNNEQRKKDGRLQR
jgi:hypothetical protein